LTISSESQRTDVSDDVLSVRQYCELFTHESKTFLFKNTPKNAIETNGAKNAQYLTFLLKDVNPSDISIHQPTPFTTPNDSSISLHNFAQLRNNATYLPPKITLSSSTISTFI